MGGDLDQELDIAISDNNVFGGHYKAHSVVSMKLNEFLSYNGHLNLYLAQHPIYSQ
mgnify:FL=1